MRSHRESAAQSDARAYIQRARKSKLSDKTPLIYHTWLSLGKKKGLRVLWNPRHGNCLRFIRSDLRLIELLFWQFDFDRHTSIDEWWSRITLPLSRHRKNERNKQLQEPMGSWQSVNSQPICFKTRRYKELPATYNKRTVLDNSKQFCRTTAAINLLNWHSGAFI